MEVKDPREQHAMTVRASHPVGNLGENVGIATISVIESRGIDQSHNVRTDLAGYFPDVGSLYMLVGNRISSFSMPRISSPD